MSKCPNCGYENEEPSKTWRYNFFTVYAYTCKKCGTQYRDYYSNRSGKHSFTLKRVEEFVKGREAPEQELLEALSSLEALSKFLVD